MWYQLKCKKTFSFEFFEHFKEVQSTWTHLSQSEQGIIGAHTEAIENSGLNGLKIYYVNVYKNQKLVGFLYLNIIKINLKGLKFKHPFLRYLGSICLNLNNEILVCGNIFKVNQEGYYFKDANETQNLTDILLSARKELSKKHHIIGVLIKDSDSNFNKKVLNCNPFFGFKTDATMVLELRPNWHTFQDYESSLSRKYKQRLKKIQVSSQDVERKSLSLEEIVQHANVIENLYFQNLNKQNFNLCALNATYFIEMKQKFQSDFDLIGYFLEGQLIAFSTYIYYQNKNEMEIHYIGINYEFNSSKQLYFNILYDGLKKAIDLKMKVLELGRTAKEAKSNMGATPFINHNYAWLRSKLIRFVAQNIIKWYDKNNSEQWVQRNPFKETSD